MILMRLSMEITLRTGLRLKSICKGWFMTYSIEGPPFKETAVQF